MRVDQHGASLKPMVFDHAQTRPTACQPASPHDSNSML